MKKIFAASLIAAMALPAFSAASAAEGCGAGFHRGPRGGCRPNGGVGYAPGVAVGVAPGLAVGVGVPVVGTYYRGRGYWDGRRYWNHRERWHGGWRYR